MELKPCEFNQNVFKMYSENWALLTAGNEEKSNSMTVSWGGFSYLWAKNVAHVYVRPSRYTYEFMEREDFFVINFLKEGYKKDLTYLGKTSGRDVDKIKNTSLTPIFIEGHPTFEECEYTIICKKIYVSDISLDDFVDNSTKEIYTDDNIHKHYIGEIVKIYQNI